MKIQFACFVVISPMLILASMAAPNFDLTAQQTQEVVGVNSAASLRMAANGDDSMAVVDDRTADKDARDWQSFRPAGCTNDYAFTYVAPGRTANFSNHAKIAPNPKKKICGWWFWTDPHNSLTMTCDSLSLRDVDYMVIYDVTNDAQYGLTNTTESMMDFNFDASTDLAIGFESEVGKEEKSLYCAVSSTSNYDWMDLGDDSRQIFILTNETVANYTEAKAFAEDLKLSLYGTIDRDVYDVHAFINDSKAAMGDANYTIYLDATYHAGTDEWKWADSTLLEIDRSYGGTEPDTLDPLDLSEPRLLLVNGLISVVEGTTTAGMLSGYRDMNTYADPTTKKREYLPWHGDTSIFEKQVKANGKTDHFDNKDLNENNE